MPKKTLVRDRILAFIVSYQDEHGFSPTMREIASGIGIASVGCVHKHINGLKEAGLLRETENQTPRALAVNKGIPSPSPTNHDQRDEVHVCLKTDTGESIILTCIPQHNSVNFVGSFCITGERNYTGHVIACHELSESDYDALACRVC